MKKRWLWMGICSLFLTACAPKLDMKDDVSLYFPNSVGDDLQLVTVTGLSRTTYSLHTALKTIEGEAPEKGLSRILPSGVTVRSVKLEGDSVMMDLNHAYADLAPSQRELMKAAIVKALTSVKGIDSVVFLVEGESLPVDAHRHYRMSDFYVLHSSPVAKVRQYEGIFYYLNADRDRLVKKVLNIRYQDNKQESRMLQELLYDQDDGVTKNVSALPKGIELKHLATEAGICSVRIENLNKEWKTAHDMDLAAYAIINTLTTLPNVNAVQLYTGEELGLRYGEERYFTTPTTRNEGEDIVVVPKNEG